MNQNYPTLFSPLTVGNVTYKNRIFAAPTGYLNTPGNHLPQESQYYYDDSVATDNGSVTDDGSTSYTDGSTDGGTADDGAQGYDDGGYYADDGGQYYDEG